MSEVIQAQKNKPFLPKLLSMLIYIVLLVSLGCYLKKYHQPTLYAFINYPCEKIQPQFPGFVDFISEYEGKLDMIRIYEAQTPFVVFSGSFEYHQDDNRFNITLAGKTKEQILNVFLDNGFKLGNYLEDVESYLKDIDQKLEESSEVKADEK